MEHIAKAIKKDPMVVRLKNIQKDDSNIQNMIEDLKIKADFEERKRNVEAFNKVSGEMYFLLFFILQIYICNQQKKSRHFHQNIAHKL
jgi:phage regulator Rha-like protein